MLLSNRSYAYIRCNLFIKVRKDLLISCKGAQLCACICRPFSRCLVHSMQPVRSSKPVLSTLFILCAG